MGIEHSFCYLTVRSGKVTSRTDDVWHVDGYSEKITHLPEQNYIWCDKFPTEYVEKAFKIPDDFNPKIHNIHLFLQEEIEKSNTPVQN